MTRLLVALDTATEAVAIGIAGSIESPVVWHTESELAPRRANSVTLSRLSDALAGMGASMRDVDAVVVGRGPGSFTGVRIGVATAKGLAHGAGVPLFGVGTLDAVAHVLARDFEGTIALVGDAMRGEVYPAIFSAEGGRARRLSSDTVAKPLDVAEHWARTLSGPVLLAGNGLAKYRDVFTDALGDRAIVAHEHLWFPSGEGLIGAFVDARETATLVGGDAGTVLPVYTRLSDAEEAERERLGTNGAPVPETGVALDVTDTPGITLRPMRSDDLDAVLAIESATFPDAWTAGMFREECAGERRSYIVAVQDAQVIGYGGVAVFVDEAHLMNLAVREDRRRSGIGQLLLARLRVLAAAHGARGITLECRRGNRVASSLYEAAGMSVAGIRPGYYADSGEDALIMWGGLPGVRGRDERGAPRVSGDEAASSPIVLAIESSCDETAAAVIAGNDRLLSNVIASQVDFHSRFGGVVPEIASRKHTEAIVGVVDEALEKAGAALDDDALRFEDLDAIVVTYGPGLVGALVVGLAYAKGLAMATGLPLVGANHLEGHIFANVLADQQVAPPLVALVVSGGHTSLVHMPQWGVYRTLGETLDDAAGEAFDKVAKVLGLGYPGGPVLSRMAAEGDPTSIDFPRAMMKSGDYAFSLSGLKTAVINHIRHEREAGREIDIPDLAASFQAAIIDVQVAKAVRAVSETGATSFCLAGGVAANPALREALRAAIEPLGVHVSVPPMHLCTDNAAMIAAAGLHRFRNGERLGLDAEAVPGLRLDTPV